MKKVTIIIVALSSQLIFSQHIALPEIPEKLDKDLQVCLKTIAQYSYINSKEAIEKVKILKIMKIRNWLYSWKIALKK